MKIGKIAMESSSNLCLERRSGREQQFEHAALHETQIRATFRRFRHSRKRTSRASFPAQKRSCQIRLLYCRFTALVVANPDSIFDPADENLAVANATGTRCFENGVDRLLLHLIVDHHFEL
jgi:hypothetical protein